MASRILIHSGKHPFDPFDSSVGYDEAMRVFGTNSGNLLFADSIFKYLYTSPDVRLASDGYQFCQEVPDFTPEAINERYDCVVLPAANWLARYYQAHLPRYAAKIRKLRIPCVVIGLGAQSGGRGDFSSLDGISAEAKDFLSAVSDHSHSISVRGEFTAECLKRLGFGNADVTGCPSFYRNLRSFTVAKPRVDRETFQLAVNGNKNLLSGLVDELFVRYPESVLFSQGDVLKVLKQRWATPWSDLKTVLSDGFSMDLISAGRVRLFGDITPWMEALSAFHFSLGTRIHGNIIALLSGVPAMVLAHDSRTTEMAAFYRIPCVPLHALRQGFDAYTLYQEADYGPLQAIYPERLQHMARFLEANGLEHTLFRENGTTPYDERIRTLDFTHSGYRFGGTFFDLARRVSPAFTRLRAARTRPAHAVPVV